MYNCQIKFFDTIKFGRVCNYNEKYNQWCNRWGRVPLETSDREIIADLRGKKRQGKKGKGEKWRKKEGKL